MDADRLLERYRELQSYLNWTNDDATRIATAAPLLETCFQRLVNDFYAEIERHPARARSSPVASRRSSVSKAP